MVGTGVGQDVGVPTLRSRRRDVRSDFLLLLEHPLAHRPPFITPLYLCHQRFHH